MHAPSSNLRVILTTAAVFGGAALLLAAAGLLPAALASAGSTAQATVQQPGAGVLHQVHRMLTRAVDTDALLKWDFTTDETVSTVPLRGSQVVKIGYGTRDVVEVVETASGVYSSDALIDPHISYPGIHRTPRKGLQGVAIWSDAGHWVIINPMSARSFNTIAPFEDGQLLVTEDGACVSTGREARC